MADRAEWPMRSSRRPGLKHKLLVNLGSQSERFKIGVIAEFTDHKPRVPVVRRKIEAVGGHVHRRGPGESAMDGRDAIARSTDTIRCSVSAKDLRSVAPCNVGPKTTRA